MLAGHPNNRRREAGFSLVELMISLVLVMMLTLALLTSYVFIARGDQALKNYGDMNAQARKLLEQFGEDLRCAVDVTNFDSGTITVTVPTTTDASVTADVTWAYDSLHSTLTRQVGAGAAVTYAQNVEAPPAFSFFYVNGNNVTTVSLVEVKQVQLKLRMLRLVAGSTTSEYVISAQFTMRAKSTAH